MTQQKTTSPKTTENQSIDTRYKLLFSQREVIEDLVRYAISEKLANSLDFSTLNEEKTQWVSVRMRHARSSDSVFSLKFKTGEPVFLILMLEFQSKPDANMAIRSSLYTLLFYESLIKKPNHSLIIDHRLPAVLPVVLYNGDAPWRYPTELFDLIALPTKSILAPYQPKQKFFLINEKIMKDKMKASLTRALFRLEFIETDHDFEQFFAEFPAFLKRIAPERQGELISAFSAYIGGVFSENGQEVPKSLIDQLLGSKRMLAKNLKKILEDKEQIGIAKGEQIGIAKGEQIGIAKGEQIGARKTLKTILMFRYQLKTLPDWAIKILNNAPIEKIDGWCVKETEGVTLKEFLK